MQMRHAILAALPIPSNMPNDTLIPIVIPPPFSIHDFLGTVQGVRTPNDTIEITDGNVLSLLGS